MAAGGRAKKRTPSDLLTWGVEVCCLKIQASSLGAGVGGWGAAQLVLVRAASSSVPRLFNALRRHLPGAGSALVPLEQGLLVNACNFMTDRVEECELKALECETIASSLAAEDDPLRRIYQDLATKWREKAQHLSADQRRRNGCHA
jgi:hypothetical protein